MHALALHDALMKETLGEQKHPSIPPFHLFPNQHESVGHHEGVAETIAGYMHSFQA
jgi:hypothetical protein